MMLLVSNSLQLPLVAIILEGLCLLVFTLPLILFEGTSQLSYLITLAY